jgi:hypothetical protein
MSENSHPSGCATISAIGITRERLFVEEKAKFASKLQFPMIGIFAERIITATANHEIL